MAANHDGVQKFQKHCVVALENTKRRFDHSDFGGEVPAIEAAKHFLACGQKLINRFEALKGNPEERKQFIKTTFGGDAFQPNKRLKAQQALLVSKLICRQVPSTEASVMQVAVRATPGVEKKDSLSLTYSEDDQKFKAVLCGENENMTKMFENLKDAKSWLLNMGKCSEAGFVNTCALISKIIRTFMMIKEIYSMLCGK